MGFGTALHYFGSLLLFASAILMIIPSIGSPTVDDIYFLKVRINQAGAASGGPVTFGSFGACGLHGQSGQCTGTHIGYNPARILFTATGNDYFSDAGRDSVKALTHVFVLHPIAAAIIFVSFLFSLKTGFLNIVTTLISLLGFIITVVCVAVDFAAFVIVKHDVNSADDGNSATYGNAIWCTLAAAIGTLLGSIIVFVTCCAGRRKNRYENRKVGY